MATWILEQCGYKPGFVIGGVPGNFEVSARLGESDFFVIEADEYDCAFFDKRSKFVHYCPRTLILNNLEFDHADIFDDLKAIQKQFHHLVRIVPGQGRIIWPENDINLKQTMAMGCWSEQELVGEQGHWQAKKLTTDASEWEVLLDGEKVGEVKWSLVGEHNMHNGLMAIAAARHVGVAPQMPLTRWVRLLTLVAVWSCVVKRMASRYMMILPITRRRFWQRWRRCVAKLVVRRALLPYWNRALIP